MYNRQTSFKSLRVTKRELIKLLKNWNISIKNRLTKKQLLELLKYYDDSDLLNLAQIRNVNTTNDINFEELEQMLITKANQKNCS